MMWVLTALKVVFVLKILAILCAWLFYPVHESEVSREAEAALLPRRYINAGEVTSSTKKIDEPASVDLTLVIPAYNEEFRMPIMLDETLQFMESWSVLRDLTYEILVVDDSSTDDTAAVARAYMSEYPYLFTYIFLGENIGKGGAVKYGVEQANGKYIMMVDADGASDIKDLPKLYDALVEAEVHSDTLKGSVGMAIGSRAHLSQKSVAQRALYRTILMHGFHMFVKLFCTNQIQDTQCGFKLFTRTAARVLFSNLHLRRWAFDIEIIHVAERLQIPMKEIAISWREIEGSKLIRTKLDVVTTSLSMARDILCVRLAYLLGLWRENLPDLPSEGHESRNSDAGTSRSVDASIDSDANSACGCDATSETSVVDSHIDAVAESVGAAEEL
jgi:dolichyl-phosphate beta-glucosyltransferase